MPTIRARIAGESVRVFYFEEGEGTPYVFIHGLGTSHRSWKNIVFPFWTREGRRIAIDLPGFGKTPALKKSFHTVAIYVEVVRQVLNALHIEKPYVIGSSMGGAVALALGIQYPAIPRAIVAHGAPYWGKEFPRDHKKELEFYRSFFPARPLGPVASFIVKRRLFIQLLTLFMADLPALVSHERIRVLFSKKNVPLSDLIRDLGFSPVAAGDILWDFMHLDLRDGLSKLRIPLFLVDGDSVSYYPVDTRKRISRLVPRSTLTRQLVLRGGHIAPYTYPEVFVDGMNRFFNEVERKQTKTKKAG